MILGFVGKVCRRCSSVSSVGQCSLRMVDIDMVGSKFVIKVGL